jgi:hypothetical protein
MESAVPFDHPGIRKILGIRSQNTRRQKRRQRRADPRERVFHVLCGIPRTPGRANLPHPGQIGRVRMESDGEFLIRHRPLRGCTAQYRGESPQRTVSFRADSMAVHKGRMK